MKAPEEIADNALVLMADIFPTYVNSLLEVWRADGEAVVSLRPTTLSKI